MRSIGRSTRGGRPATSALAMLTITVGCALLVAPVAGAGGAAAAGPGPRSAPVLATDPPVEPPLEPAPPVATDDPEPTATPKPSATTVPPTDPAEPSDTATPTLEPTTAPASTPPPTTAAPAPPVVERPATPPAVSGSDLPWASVVLALLVLVGTVVLVRRLSRGDGGSMRRPEPVGAATDVRHRWDPADPATLAFLVALGQAMLDSTDPVTHVGPTLRRVAARNGIADAEIVVLPTALFVSIPGGGRSQTALAGAGTSDLPLHRVEGVFGVVDRALRGELAAADGLTELRVAREEPAPFSATQQLFGYTALTVGLALLLRGSLADVVVAGVLGTLVGAVQLLQHRWPTAHQVFAPAGAAFAVTVAVLLLARTEADLGVYPPIIAPLITFLPGALLTTGVIELATGQMISGAGRLAAGAMRLALLALGIIAAAQLVGVPATTLDDASADPLGVLAPWIGVAIFGAGVVVGRVARRSALPWILLILYAAYAGQLIGGALLGSQLSAFTGALAMTPVAMFAATQRTGPSTLVSFLPGFWLLVPGAVGLTGVTKFLGADRLDGLATLAATGTTMIAIAFGVLIGLALGTLLGLGDDDGPLVRGRRRRREAAQS